MIGFVDSLDICSLFTLMPFLWHQIPGVADANVFAMGLRIVVTKDLCSLESRIGQ